MAIIETTRTRNRLVTPPPDASSTPSTGSAVAATSAESTDDDDGGDGGDGEGSNEACDIAECVLPHGHSDGHLNSAGDRIVFGRPTAPAGVESGFSRLNLDSDVISILISSGETLETLRHHIEANTMSKIRGLAGPDFRVARRDIRKAVLELDS